MILCYIKYLTGGGQNYLPESTIWIAVKDEDAHMLTDDVYDAFVLVPLYICMFYKEDLHIHGCVSKKLYKNVMNYLQRILCDFSDDLSRIDVQVDGFKIADGEPNIIGTGISCGVDSLTTIYDHYVNENDPDYKISGLLFYNCGSHGKYGSESKKLFFDRYNLNKAAADELGLPVYLIDSNLHAFFANIGHDQNIGHLARWSCILAVQREVKKYYLSSTYSYTQITKFGSKIDFAEFSESFSVPLVRTERCELIIDGCQYERTRKTEHIADWDIAQKYMNVCVNASAKGHNCSICGKCLRTLIALETMNKLNDFEGVFDINTYRRHSFSYKCRIVLKKNNDAFDEDNYNFAKAHGMNLPLPFIAYMYFLPSKLSRLMKRAVRKIIGNRLYDKIKNLIKR